MNTICALGLFPWLFHFFNIWNNAPSFHKYIPLAIFTNGILYHVFYPENESIFLLDTISNNIFITYINFTTYNQPDTFFYTMVAIIAYCFNKAIHLSVIHVVFIQWLLLVAYTKSYPYQYQYQYPYQYKKISTLLYDFFHKFSEALLKDLNIHADE